MAARDQTPRQSDIQALSDLIAFVAESPWKLGRAQAESYQDPERLQKDVIGLPGELILGTASLPTRATPAVPAAARLNALADYVWGEMSPAAKGGSFLGFPEVVASKAAKLAAVLPALVTKANDLGIASTRLPRWLAREGATGEDLTDTAAELLVQRSRPEGEGFYRFRDPAAPGGRTPPEYTMSERDIIREFGQDVAERGDFTTSRPTGQPLDAPPEWIQGITDEETRVGSLRSRADETPDLPPAGEEVPYSQADEAIPNPSLEEYFSTRPHPPELEVWAAEAGIRDVGELELARTGPAAFFTPSTRMLDNMDLAVGRLRRGATLPDLDDIVLEADRMNPFEFTHMVSQGAPSGHGARILSEWANRMRQQFGHLPVEHEGRQLAQYAVRASLRAQALRKVAGLGVPRHGMSTLNQQEQLDRMEGLSRRLGLWPNHAPAAIVDKIAEVLATRGRHADNDWLRAQIIDIASASNPPLDPQDLLHMTHGTKNPAHQYVNQPVERSRAIYEMSQDPALREEINAAAEFAGWSNTRLQEALARHRDTNPSDYPVPELVREIERRGMEPDVESFHRAAVDRMEESGEALNRWEGSTDEDLLNLYEETLNSGDDALMDAVGEELERRGLANFVRDVTVDPATGRLHVPTQEGDLPLGLNAERMSDDAIRAAYYSDNFRNNTPEGRAVMRELYRRSLDPYSMRAGDPANGPRLTDRQLAQRDAMQELVPNALYIGSDRDYSDGAGGFLRTDPGAEGWYYFDSNTGALEEVPQDIIDAALEGLE